MLSTFSIAVFGKMIAAYMSIMTMSVLFFMAASSWKKFLTTVVNVSNVSPPQITICLPYKQNQDPHSFKTTTVDYESSSSSSSSSSILFIRK